MHTDPQRPTHKTGSRVLGLLMPLEFLEGFHQTSQTRGWRCPLCEGQRPGLEPGLSSKDLKAVSARVQ